MEWLVQNHLVCRSVRVERVFRRLGLRCMFLAPFRCTRLGEGAHSTRQEGRRKSRPRSRSPLWRKAGEMKEDHTSAPLGACPCHQLRAHESRAEAYSVDRSSSVERPVRMNTQAVTRQPSSLLLTSSSTLRDLADHRDHETCLS